MRHECWFCKKIFKTHVARRQHVKEEHKRATQQLQQSKAQLRRWREEQMIKLRNKDL